MTLDPDVCSSLRTWRHYFRFKHEHGTRYARRVREAVGVERAARMSDREVRDAVRDWETAHGMTPIDWESVGSEERAG